MGRVNGKKKRKQKDNHIICEEGRLGSRFALAYPLMVVPERALS